MTLAMKSLSLSRNDTTTQNYCLGIDLLNIISSWYEENYLKPYFFTLSTWKIFNEAFERIYRIVKKSTSHIDEIQDFRWTSSSGTWRTCYWGQQVSFYKHLHAMMPDIKAAHPLNPRPEHQVRHPHLQTIILTVALKYFVIIVKMVLWWWLRYCGWRIRSGLKNMKSLKQTTFSPDRNLCPFWPKWASRPVNRAFIWNARSR